MSQKHKIPVGKKEKRTDLSFKITFDFGSVFHCALIRPKQRVCPVQIVLNVYFIRRERLFRINNRTVTINK